MSVEGLERELNSARKALKLEEKERDDLENENRQLEKQLKQKEATVRRLQDDLSYESKERDNLEKENYQLSHQLRNSESQIKFLKNDKVMLEEDVHRAKQQKDQLQKKLEQVERDNELENDQLRDEVRKLRRDMRDKVRRLEDEKDTLERQLKRATGKKQDQEIKRLERELSLAQSQLKLNLSSLSTNTSGKTFDERAVNEILEQKKNVESERDKALEKSNILQEEVNKLKKELQSFEEFKKETEEEKQKLKSRSRGFDKEREELNEKITNLENQLKTTKNELDEAGEYAEKTAQTEIFLKKEIEELKQSIHFLNTRKEEAENEKEDLEEQLSQAKVEFREVENELLLKLEAAQQTGGGSEELEELNHQLSEKEKGIKQLERKCDQATEEMEHLEKQLKETKLKAETDLTELEEQKSKLNQLVKELELKLQTIEKQAQDETDRLKRKLEKEVFEEKQKNASQLRKIETLEDQVQKLERELKEFKTKEGSTIQRKKNYLFELSTTQENLESAKQQQGKLREELNQSDLKIQTLKNKKLTLQKDVKSLEERLEEKERELKKALESQKEELSQTITTLEEQGKKNREEKHRIAQEAESAKNEIHNLQNELDRTKKKHVSELQEHLQRLGQEKDEKQKLEQEIQTLKQEIENLQKSALKDQDSSSDRTSQDQLHHEREKVSSLEKSVKKLETENKQLNKKMRLMEDEIDDLINEVEDEKENSERIEKRKKELEGEIRVLEENFQELTNKRTRVTQQTENLKREVAEKTEQVNQLSEKNLKLEKEMNQQLEDLQNELIKAKNEAGKAKTVLDEEQKQKETLLEKVKSLEEDLQMASQKGKSEQEAQNLEQSVIELRGQNNILQEAKKKQTKEIQDLTNEVKQFQEKNEHTKERKIFWKQKCHEQEERLQNATRAKENVETELAMLNQKMKALHRVEESNKDYEKKIDRLQKDLQQEKETRRTLKEEAEEVSRLRQELARLRQDNASASSGGEFSELSGTGPRLSVPRKPLGPRQIKKGVQDLGTSETSSVSSEPARPDPSAIGGVSLFGNLKVGQSVLKKTASPVPVLKKKKEFQKTLWCLKGRRRIRSFQVECSSAGLNQGDVFILDAGEKIYQWNGSKCNRMERTKGKDITSRLNRTKGNRAELITLDEGDDDDLSFKFWTDLGGKKGSIKTAEEGGDDLEMENILDSKTTLYHIQDDLSMDTIQGKLVQEMLDASRCYILDCETEVYIWTGKQSDRDFRMQAVQVADQLFQSKTRPDWGELRKEVQGGESVWFCEKFSNWNEGASFINVGTVSSPNTKLAQSKKQEEIDVNKMHSQDKPEVSSLRKEVIWNDECELQIFKVIDAEKEAVPQNLFGQFWSSHSYVIQLRYGNPSDPSYIIYFWQGRGCSKNEKGTSAALALNLAKRLPGSTQIRIPQGKETKEFLNLFQGKMIVHLGKDDGPRADVSLYHVRGTSEGGVSSFQVAASMNRLNGGDCFVLWNEKDKSCIVWKGKYADQVETDAAALVAKELCGSEPSQVVSQENETQTFIELLGGAQEYPKTAQAKKIKFFQFTNRTGVLTAERIWDWSQDDLELMVILDTIQTIFLWFGKDARENDKKFAMKTTLEYLSKAPLSDRRPQDCQVVEVIEGQEPLSFVTHFHAWDKPIIGGNAKLRGIRGLLDAYDTKYSYEELQNKAKLPDSVDKTRLEDYLTDEEFIKVFGMDRSAWEKTAPWKKTKLKQEKKLY